MLPSFHPQLSYRGVLGGDSLGGGQGREGEWIGRVWVVQQRRRREWIGGRAATEAATAAAAASTPRTAAGVAVYAAGAARGPGEAQGHGSGGVLQGKHS